MGGGATSIDDPSAGEKQPENTQETTYTFKAYEDYFIDYFNLPAETYTRDETTNVVTINYSSIKRTTANGETELSYNGNVFYVVTSEDLTGTGSSTDPYVVHSTNGFLYLTNNSMSKISLGSKFLELNCDIILNDETFDEDGNPSGGNGVVYFWKPIERTDYAVINGNLFKISGFYFFNENQNDAYLFGRSTYNCIKNLVFDNVFNKAGNNVALFNRIVEAENCILLKGCVSGKRTVAPFVRFVKYIKDCKNNNFINFSNDTNSSYVSGLVSQVDANGIIKNCYNYSDVIGGQYVGGIVSYSHYDRVSIINSHNFGNIKATYYVGGITSAIISGSLNIIDCCNYGSIVVADGSSIGGCIGYTTAKLYIENFASFGNIIANEGSGGGFVGAIYKYNQNSADVVIKNSIVEFKGNTSCVSGFIGSMTHDAKCTIKDSVFRDHNFVSNGVQYLINRVVNETNLNIKNLYIDIKSQTNSSFYIFKTVKSEKEVNLEYIYCNINCDGANLKILNDVVYKNLKTLSLIICGYNNNFYYGSDFSGFYFSWRTGQIGLVALDGRGSFQGAVTEEWLKNRGFEKKEI